MAEGDSRESGVTTSPARAPLDSQIPAGWRRLLAAMQTPLSAARAGINSSQYPTLGRRIASAPIRASAWAISGNQESKQIMMPRHAKSVSNTRSSSPGRGRHPVPIRTAEISGTYPLILRTGRTSAPRYAPDRRGLRTPRRRYTCSIGAPWPPAGPLLVRPEAGRPLAILRRRPPAAARCPVAACRHAPRILPNEAEWRPRAPGLRGRQRSRDAAEWVRAPRSKSLARSRGRTRCSENKPAVPLPWLPPGPRCALRLPGTLPRSEERTDRRSKTDRKAHGPRGAQYHPFLRPPDELEACKIFPLSVARGSAHIHSIHPGRCLPQSEKPLR